MVSSTSKPSSKSTHKGVVDQVAPFLIEHGSNLLTLFYILYGDRESAQEAFRDELFVYLKGLNVTRRQIRPLEFFEFVLDTAELDDRVRPENHSSLLWRLEKELQVITWLRDGVGLRYSEIAQVTGLSQSEIKSKIHEARRKLGEEYGKDRMV